MWASSLFVPFELQVEHLPPLFHTVRCNMLVFLGCRSRIRHDYSIVWTQFQVRLYRTTNTSSPEGLSLSESVAYNFLPTTTSLRSIPTVINLVLILVHVLNLVQSFTRFTKFSSYMYLARASASCFEFECCLPARAAF